MCENVLKQDSLFLMEDVIQANGQTVAILTGWVEPRKTYRYFRFGEEGGTLAHEAETFMIGVVDETSNSIKFQVVVGF